MNAAADPRPARLEAAFRAMRYAEALPLAEALRSEARRAGDDAARSRHAVVLAKIHANEGRHPPALEAAREAAEAADRLDDPDLQAAAWGLMASENARCDRPRDAMQAVSRLLMVAHRIASPGAQIDLQSALSFTYRALGLPMQALDHARRALALADAGAPDPGRRLRLAMNLVAAGHDAWDLLETTDPAAAKLLLDELQLHCDWVDPVTAELQRRGERGRAGYLKGRTGCLRRAGEAEAVVALLSAFLRPEWNGPADLRADLWIELAQAQRDTGRAADVATSLAQAARAVAEQAGPPAAADLLRQAAIAELSGRHAEALALLRRHQRRLHAHVLAALEARLDELSGVLNAQALRLENAELRLRAEGLAASVREVEALAATDPLTGVPNRRSLEAAFSGLAAADGPLTLAIIDLDHFKAVNDRHSHLIGDAVLRESARLLAAGLRAPDRLGRYGGEEFVVLLPGLDEAAAHAVLERLRQRLREHPWHELAPGLALTMSAGCALRRNGEDLAGLVARADARLYRAKHAGRDRVCSDDAPATP